MKYDTCNFFDKNINFYGNKRIYNYDYYFIYFMKNTSKNKTLNLLDIGGGVGTFAKLAITEIADIEVTVLDPSQEMLNKIENNNIKKSIGMLPDKIYLNSRFNYIHVKEVFHHITGSSIEESKKLLKKSLLNIKKLLKDDGFLLIHEIFYESPYIPTLSSTLIYYLLKLQNKFGTKVPIKEFLLDLDIYFYTRTDFRKILDDCGYEIVNYYEERWSNTLKKRLIFVKDWGRMVFICKKVV